MNLERSDLRDEAEHDAFMTFVVKAADALTRHKWAYIGTAGALAAVALIVMAVLHAGRLKEERAAVLMGRATAFIEIEQVEAARPLLEKMRDEYGGTRSGREARYFLGMNALQAEQLGEARSELTAFLAAAKGQDFMTAAAQAGLAVCDERERKWEDAARAWTKAALMDEQGNFNAPVYLLNAALCWEQAGKAAEALPLLDRILEKYPKAAVKSRVEVVQARMKARG
ncbi:MAG: hypothetical protein Q8O14_13180 [bacterium]|jgi:tetratricopeptide (TPR) repeat protein|nr:hypothetical protein [bacterium]